MPSIPTLLLGFNTTFLGTSIPNVYNNNSDFSPSMHPFVGAYWDRSILVAEFRLQHTHQFRHIGENDYSSHEGITYLGIDYRRTLHKKDTTIIIWDFFSKWGEQCI